MSRPSPYRAYRARRLCSWIVLAALGLRAFIPVGYMLASVDGRLAVTLCDADTSLAPHAAHHHHFGTDPPAHHHTHLDPACPYAQSAGPAPLPALPMATPVPIDWALQAPTPRTQNHSPFGPVREHPSRGPPLLA